MIHVPTVFSITPIPAPPAPSDPTRHSAPLAVAPGREDALAAIEQSLVLLRAVIDPHEWPRLHAEIVRAACRSGVVAPASPSPINPGDTHREH